MESWRDWVDRRGLMHRTETTMLGQTVVMTFSRFGEPVDIEAPSASEIGPAPSAFAG